MSGAGLVQVPLALGDGLPLLPFLGQQPSITATSLECELALQLAPRVDAPLRDVTSLDAGGDRAARLAVVSAVGEPARGRELLDLGEGAREALLRGTVQRDASQSGCVDDDGPT